MPCYHPLTAWRKSGPLLPSGKRAITFKESEGIPFTEMKIPCGQCIGCRLERSRQWAARCVLEAKSHAHNSFITLTYAPEHLPGDGSLHYDHFQRFMKRFRKALVEEYAGAKVRFFMCGEYGTKNLRPHFHAIIFGFDFPDRYLFFVSNGNRVYRSPFLERLWPYGISSIGEVTFESAAYVARYVTKKITGPHSEEHYQGLQPEFCRCSLKPAIAKDFCQEYMDDIYTQDKLVLSERIIMKPPRYFDKVLEMSDPERFKQVKEVRVAKGREFEKTGETRPSRLSVRERCKMRQVAKLVRPLENV